MFPPPATATVRTYGLCVSLEATAPATLESMLALLPQGWKYVSSSRVDRTYALTPAADEARQAHHDVYQDGVRIARFPAPDMMLSYLGDRLEEYIVEQARNRVFLHAAALGWKGRAVLIPGRSFTGKTTLAAELVRRGATYLSDEYAVIDKRGRVHPFARPLSVRDGREIRHVAVEALGGRQGRTPLPIALVVVSPYEQRRRWRPRELSEGTALLELLAHVTATRREPQRTLATLERVVAGALVLKGGRGEAGPVADAILARLDGAAAA